MSLLRRFIIIFIMMMMMTFGSLLSAVLCHFQSTLNSLGFIYLFLGLVSGASSLSNNQPCEVRWVFPEITSQKIMQLKRKGKKNIAVA